MHERSGRRETPKRDCNSRRTHFKQGLVTIWKCFFWGRWGKIQFPFTENKLSLFFFFFFHFNKSFTGQAWPFKAGFSLVLFILRFLDLSSYQSNKIAPLYAPSPLETNLTSHWINNASSDAYYHCWKERKLILVNTFAVKADDLFTWPVLS